MKKFFLTTATLLSVFSFTFGQAWGDVNGFTDGAEIALHRVWGKQKGYSSERTVAVADSIYKNGNFKNRKLRNSEVTSDGTIKPLPVGEFLSVPLGTIDATLLEPSKVGLSANIYLKGNNGCRNLSWALVEKVPEETPVETPEEKLVSPTPTPAPAKPADKPAETGSSVVDGETHIHIHMDDDEEEDKDEEEVTGATANVQWYDPLTGRCFLHGRKWWKCRICCGANSTSFGLGVQYSSRGGLALNAAFGYNQYGYGYGGYGCPSGNILGYQGYSGIPWGIPSATFIQPSNLVCGQSWQQTGPGWADFVRYGKTGWQPAVYKYQ